MLRLCQTINIYVKNPVLLAERKIDMISAFQLPTIICSQDHPVFEVFWLFEALKLVSYFFLCFRNIFRGLWKDIKLNKIKGIRVTEKYGERVEWNQMSTWKCVR